MPHTPLYEVEIDAHQFEDAARFEAGRQEAYAADEAERGPRLQRLVETATVAGGLAVYDVALEKLTHAEDTAEAMKDAALKRFEETSERVASTETHRKHGQTTYRISLGQGGEVVGVSKIEPIKEDKRITNRSKQISDRTGWGPKMNSSSFRGSTIDPSRRRG